MYIFLSLIAAALTGIITVLWSLSKEKNASTEEITAEKPSTFFSSNKELEDIPTATDFSILQDTIIYKREEKKKEKKHPLKDKQTVRKPPAQKNIVQSETSKDAPALKEGEGTQEFEELKEKHEKIEAILSEKKTEAEVSQKKLDIQLEKSTNYEKIKKILEEEIDVLRHDKKKILEEMTALKNSINNSAEEIASLKKTLSDIQSNLVDKEQENDRLKKKLQAFEAGKPARVASQTQEPMPAGAKDISPQQLTHPPDDSASPKKTKPADSIFQKKKPIEGELRMDDTPNISYKDLTVTPLAHSSLEIKHERPKSRSVPSPEKPAKRSQPSPNSPDLPTQSQNYQGSGFGSMENDYKKSSHPSDADNMFDNSDAGRTKSSAGRTSDDDEHYDLKASNDYQSAIKDLSQSIPPKTPTEEQETTIDLSHTHKYDSKKYEDNNLSPKNDDPESSDQNKKKDRKDLEE